MIESLKNHFLMAMPTLSEGFFAGSLTYICEHNEAGAMGIVVNQPLDVGLDEILEHLDIPHRPETTEQVILAGGPVRVDHGFVLHNGDGEWDSTLQVASGISLTTSRDVLAAIGRDSTPTPDCYGLRRLGRRALEDELARNSWLTVPASPDILFAVPCEERLQAAGHCLGIDIRLLSSAAGHA